MRIKIILVALIVLTCQQLIAQNFDTATGQLGVNRSGGENSLGTDSRANSIPETISRFEKDFSVAVVYNVKVDDTWAIVNYKNCDDSVETLQYLDLLYKEYSKYPKGFFQMIQLKTIVLGKRLKYGEQYRSAVPDPLKNSLYLSIDGQNGVYFEEYLIHVMHHELNHCTEYAIWKSMYYKWRKWKKTNRFLFSYKGGGVKAYKKAYIDWFSMTHPRKGFLNLYSTTGQEEDRSELIAFIMCDVERETISQYYKKDKILRRKIDIMLALMNDFCKTNNNYWQNNLQELVSKK